MPCRLLRCCRVRCLSVLLVWGLGRVLDVGMQAGLLVEVEMLGDVGED